MQRAIVKTRYQDIDWEQARAHFHDGDDRAWSRFRGKPVKIFTPQLSSVQSPLCEGPFFEVVGWARQNGDPVSVCPHVCEIGD